MRNASLRPFALPLAILSVLAPVILFSGCGQKGPLFLPGNPSEIRTEVPEQNAPTAEQQIDDEADKDDDEDSEVQPE
jgi:predicted small lipoprotein YifL